MLIARMFSLAAVLALLTSPAGAYDAKVLNGSACSQANSGTMWAKVPFGGINFDGNSIPVTCPLPRDNISNSNGLSSLQLRISLPPGTSMSCRAVAMEPSGGLAIKSVTKQTSDAGDSTLDWGSSLNASVRNGSYAIDCTVPSGGVIYSIRYTEP